MLIIGCLSTRLRCGRRRAGVALGSRLAWWRRRWPAPIWSGGRRWDGRACGAPGERAGNWLLRPQRDDRREIERELEGLHVRADEVGEYEVDDRGGGNVPQSLLFGVRDEVVHRVDLVLGGHDAF